MTEFLRTPEDRFKNLPNFPYQPNYVSFENLRIAYVDEKSNNYNPDTSQVFLCLHGVPSWSYLYRNMIPVFLNSSRYNKSGVRVICPDFIGWGRSDKPTKDSFHNATFHRNSILFLIKQLNLKNITLVVQDWGGLIGLTLPMEKGFTPRFKRLIVFNTGLLDGAPPTPGFLNWRNYVSRTPDMDCFRLFKRSSPHLPKEELLGYSAPFPNKDYKAAIRSWPLMVPITPEDLFMDTQRKATFFWEKNKRSKTNKIEIYQAHGLRDPVFIPQFAFRIYDMFFGLKNYNPFNEIRRNNLLWIPQGGHFVQHDAGEYLATKALKYFGDIPYDYVEYEYLYNGGNKLINRTKYKNDTRHGVLISISNPSNGNSLTKDLLLQLNSLLLRLEDDPYAGGYLLTSVPYKRIFSGGYDVSLFVKNDKNLTRNYFRTIYDNSRILNSIGKPVICVLNGTSVAGGVVLALNCDYRISRSGVNVALNESALGINVGDGTLNLLTDIVGRKTASYIFQTGVFADSETATYDWKMIDQYVDTNDDTLLLNEAWLVLENKYFNGQLAASGHIRKLSRRHRLKLYENPQLVEKALDETIDAFHRDSAQRSFRALINRRKKNLNCKLQHFVHYSHNAYTIFLN